MVLVLLEWQPLTRSNLLCNTTQGFKQPTNDALQPDCANPPKRVRGGLMHSSGAAVNHVIRPFSQNGI